MFRNFCLFLPQGGLTTQYSANYESVDLGFFGQVVENNIGEITNNISQYFDQYQNDTQNLSIGSTYGGHNFAPCAPFGKI